MKFTYFKIEKIFSEIQENEELFNVKIEGWPIWSIIKSQLYMRCGSKLISNNNERFVSKIIRNRKQVFNQIIKVFTANIEWWKIKKQLPVNRKRPLVLFIFFGGHRFKNDNGKMENPFGERLIMQANKPFDSFVIEKTKGFIQYKNVVTKPDLSEDIISFPGYLGLNLDSTKRKEYKTKLKELLAIIEKSIPSEYVELVEVIRIEIFSKLVYRALFNFFSYKKKAKNILGQINPKLIVLTASSGHLGIIGAAKEMNIKVVEIQHGVFSEYYTVYQWPKFYKHRKNELPIPDKLFMWGKYWIDLQLKLGFWNKSELVQYGNVKIENKTGQLINQSLKTNSNNAKATRILYTTTRLYRNQSIAYLDEFIFLSIELNKPIFVSIKLHPYEDDEYSYYDEYLRQKYPNNCKIFYHRDKPLYDLFAQNDVHLSVISASIFESIEMNLPTVVINYEGMEYYKDIINMGIIKYADKPMQMIEILDCLNIESICHKNWMKIISDSRNYFFCKTNAKDIVQNIGEWIR